MRSKQFGVATFGALVLGAATLTGCTAEPGYYGGATQYGAPIYSGGGRGYERPYYVEPSYDRRGPSYRSEPRYDNRREQRAAPREERRAAPAQSRPGPGITAPFARPQQQRYSGPPDAQQRPGPADREGGR